MLITPGQATRRSRNTYLCLTDFDIQIRLFTIDLAVFKDCDNARKIGRARAWKEKVKDPPPPRKYASDCYYCPWQILITLRHKEKLPPIEIHLLGKFDHCTYFSVIDGVLVVLKRLGDVTPCLCLVKHFYSPMICYGYSLIIAYWFGWIINIFVRMYSNGNYAQNVRLLCAFWTSVNFRPETTTSTLFPSNISQLRGKESKIIIVKSNLMSQK